MGFFLECAFGMLIGWASELQSHDKKGSAASLCGQALLVDAIALVRWRAFRFWGLHIFSLQKKLSEIQAQKSLCEVRSIS